MKKGIFTSVALAFCLVFFFAIAAGVDGQWSGVFNSPDGSSYPLTYNFKLDGEKLSGTLDVAGLTVPVDSGKVVGNDVWFSVTVQGTSYAHKGKLYAAADSIGLDVTFNGNKTHTTLKKGK